MEYIIISLAVIGVGLLIRVYVRDNAYIRELEEKVNSYENQVKRPRKTSKAV